MKNLFFAKLFTPYKALDIDGLVKQDPLIVNDIFLIFIPTYLYEPDDRLVIRINGKSEFGVRPPSFTGDRNNYHLDTMCCAVEGPRYHLFAEHVRYFPIGIEAGSERPGKRGLIYMIEDNRLFPV